MKTKMIRAMGVSVAAPLAGHGYRGVAAGSANEPVDRGLFVSATIQKAGSAKLAAAQ